LNRRVSLSAPAKVNLFLKVFHRRPDGFHELQTLMQAIDFSDVVLVELDNSGQVKLENRGIRVGPANENLAHRAACAYRKAAGLKMGVNIRLTKNIPAGAGLGGGSSDAAAVLRALDHLTEGLLGTEALGQIASELGSDVPFFLCNSTTALAYGRGEMLKVVKPLPAQTVLLVLPPVHMSTAKAYEMLGRSSNHDRSREPGMRGTRMDWDTIISLAHNDFEIVTSDFYPHVQQSLTALRQKEYPLVLLSGSGAACFAITNNDLGAEADARDLKEQLGWFCVVTRTLESYPQVTLV